MTTLTIAADEDVIRRLERIAADRRTDVGAVIASALEAYAGSAVPPVDAASLPPNTRHALGLLKGLPEMSDKVLVTEALLAKHGFTT